MGMTDVWNFQDEALARIDLHGFEVRARDGALGKVVHAIEGRAGGYLVLDPGVEMPLGRQLLVPAGLVERVDVDDKRVSLGAEREQIRNAPEFDLERPLDERSRSLFGDYFRTLAEKATRRTAQSSRTRSSGNSSARARPTARRSGAKRSSTRSRQRSSGASDPTKAQLYAQAKKLGIEGRSKMNKPELARAVSRRGGRQSGVRGSRAKASPIDVQAFLEGVGYPAGKTQLLREAESQRADRDVRATLRRLPDRRFNSPTEVSEAIGKLR